jgi:hypothetical protein
MEHAHAHTHSRTPTHTHTHAHTHAHAHTLCHVKFRSRSRAFVIKPFTLIIYDQYTVILYYFGILGLKPYTAVFKL